MRTVRLDRHLVWIFLYSGRISSNNSCVVFFLRKICRVTWKKYSNLKLHHLESHIALPFACISLVAQQIIMATRSAKTPMENLTGTNTICHIQIHIYICRHVNIVAEWSQLVTGVVSFIFPQFQLISKLQ